VTDMSDAPCDEQRRLLQLYEAHTTAFATALATLNQRMGTVSKVKYGALRRAVEEARLVSERSRLALEEHVALMGVDAHKPGHTRDSAMLAIRSK
jgi:hypothetical protein